MFEVRDKNNKKLWIKDKIIHTYQDGPETISLTGVVISFPEENYIQYQPLDEHNKDTGLPKTCLGDQVVQVDSLAERALTLKTDEDFQQLIKDATERYLSAVENTKKKKAGTRGGRTPKVEQPVFKVIGGSL